MAPRFFPSLRTKDAVKPKKITVTLTRLEAENLLFAASNVFDHEDALEASFPNKRERNAAFRAHDKIQLALHTEPTYVPKMTHGPEQAARVGHRVGPGVCLHF
jgi:hypothetical protein